MKMTKENIRIELSKEDHEKVKAWTKDRESFINVAPHATKAEIILIRCSEVDVPVRISMELYPKLAETAKKLRLTLDELVEWAVIDRFLYDMRFPAIARLYSGRNIKLRDKFSRRHEAINAKIQVGFEKIRTKVAATL